MFLAVTLLLTLLEISFGRRNPRPRARARHRPRTGRRFKGGRTGLNDYDEYLEGHSYESYQDSYGEDCNDEEYDCDNYSYEPSGEPVEPPPPNTQRPATQRPATPRPATAATPAPVNPNLLANGEKCDWLNRRID